MSTDRLASYEPAHVDELAILLRHALVHMQQPDGSAVWLRLSTRAIAQPERDARSRRGDRRRALGGAARRRARASRWPIRGRWRPRRRRPSPCCARRSPAPGCWPSPARTGCTPAGWRQGGRAGPASAAARAHIERILAPLAPGAALVTVLDGHPASHSWLGAVRGQRVVPLGVDHFGQSGDIPDLYREYGLDEDAILDACAQALLG